MEIFAGQWLEISDLDRRNSEDGFRQFRMLR